MPILPPLVVYIFLWDLPSHICPPGTCILEILEGLDHFLGDYPVDWFTEDTAFVDTRDSLLATAFVAMGSWQWNEAEQGKVLHGNIYHSNDRKKERPLYKVYFDRQCIETENSDGGREWIVHVENTVLMPPDPPAPNPEGSNNGGNGNDDGEGNGPGKHSNLTRKFGNAGLNGERWKESKNRRLLPPPPNAFRAQTSLNLEHFKNQATSLFTLGSRFSNGLVPPMAMQMGGKCTFLKDNRRIQAKMLRFRNELQKRKASGATNGVTHLVPMKL